MLAHEKIAVARQLFRHGRRTEALKCIADVPDDYPWSAMDLIMKSRLIQLVDDDDQFTLDDAKRCLQRAVEEDPTDPNSPMELAFFESRVMAMPKEAELKFSTAAEWFCELLGECLGGLVEMSDVDDSEERARRLLGDFLSRASQKALASMIKTLNPIAKEKGSGWRHGESDTGNGTDKTSIIFPCTTC